MLRFAAAFGRFWWDFVVGDDWRLAVGVAIALSLTWLLERGGSDVWWLLPLAIPLVLAGSLWHEVRRQTRAPRVEAATEATGSPPS